LSFDFPSSPTDGQEYAPSGGPTYVWHPSVWTVKPAASGSTITPSDAAPAMDGTAAAGTSALYSRGDHVHPTDATRYAATNPSGYQTAANVTTALGPYAPLASPTFTSGVTVSSGSLSLTAVGFQIELGSTTSAGTPVIDMHSSGFANDHDVRLLASGGTSGQDGKGSLSVTATSVFLPTTSATDFILNADAGQTLMAGAWSQTTPTSTPQGGAITASTTTVRYKKIGRTVTFTISVTITTAGTGSGVLTVPMPFTAATHAGLAGKEIAITGKPVSGFVVAGSATAQLIYFDSTTFIANGAVVAASGHYEATT
jgi:hypothetical protein